MRSLRLRFAVSVFVGQLVLLGVGTYAAYQVGRGAITRQFDSGLTQQARILASMLEQEGNAVTVELDETFMQEYFLGDEPDLFQLFYGGVPFGNRSPGLGEHDLTFRAGTLQEPAIWNEVLPDGRRGRCVGIEVTVEDVEEDPRTGEMPEPATIAIVLAKGRGDLERLSSLLLLGLLGADALLLLCGLGVLWGAVTLSLGPIRSLARRVSAVDAHTVSVPLESESVPRELRPIVTGTNDLLQRLDEALRAERRAASNMAHELMTPISELRALSEVALHEESEPAYRERALVLAHEISVQMANLIKMVRQLTLVDAGAEILPGEPIALAPVVERVVGAVRTRADAKQLRVDVDVNGEVLECNRDALLSVCNNLVGNAVEYTPEHGSIQLTSMASDATITIRISNDCTDLSGEHVARLTEPFWRRSASRSDTTHHHGLGLTIAQGMATLAGLELRFDVRDDTFVAEIVTPKSAA